MSLLPPGDFTPLFRLLDDYDTHRSARDPSTARSFSPRFDVCETSNAYYLDGELPGIAQEDIDIEFSDRQTLVVKGRTEREHRTSDQHPNKETEQTEANGKPASTCRFWISERSFGEFRRTFSFPTPVDQDNVKARLMHGVLSIIIPKATAAASRKIMIE